MKTDFIFQLSLSP